LAFAKGVHAFENGVLAFENGVLAFEKVVLEMFYLVKLSMQIRPSAQGLQLASGTCIVSLSKTL
jgi:hypothetical protein